MALSKYQIFQDVDNISSWLKDGSGNAISSTGGALDVNIASGDLTVDLSHTEDSVALGNGTNLLTSTTVGADIGLDVNIINASVVVSATDLDIRDLTHASDSVKIGDGTDFLAVNADGSINANVTGAGFASGVYGANSVGNTATAITAGTSGRDKVLLQALDRDVYIGFNASVTTSNGILVPKGGSYEMEVSDGVTLHGITASGTCDLRYQELSA
jgi:hypothetical protein